MEMAGAGVVPGDADKFRFTLLTDGDNILLTTCVISASAWGVLGTRYITLEDNSALHYAGICAWYG